MRKARKFLCLLLCAGMLLSMSASVLGANNNYSSWFQTNYDEINKLGLMPESFNGLDLTKNITHSQARHRLRQGGRPCRDSRLRQLYRAPELRLRIDLQHS